DNPADDNVRLVYADWLDEQADERSRRKAAFLRITAGLSDPTKKAGWRKARRKELQALAAELDTHWLAGASRRKVGNWRVKGGEWQGRYLGYFDFLCDRQWGEMTPTEDAAVRFCEGCTQYVHYCDTIAVARLHAQQGHCVAVDLGIIRRDGDL